MSNMTLPDTRTDAIVRDYVLAELAGLKDAVRDWAGHETGKVDSLGDGPEFFRLAHHQTRVRAGMQLMDVISGRMARVKKSALAERAGGVAT